MSTSRSREAPIAYMSGDGQNVMWTLHPQMESDTAYHYGADISMISQFGEEKEVLYPPCTMLQVQRLKRGERKRTSTLADAIRKTKEAEKKQDLHDLIDKVGAKASMVTEGTKSFLSINVLPRYV